MSKQFCRTFWYEDAGFYNKESLRVLWSKIEPYFCMYIHNIMPVTPEGLGRGVPINKIYISLLMLKSNVIGGEPIALFLYMVQK